MKRFVLVLAGGLLLTGVGTVWAHEGHEAKTEQEAVAENTGQDQTLTGEVVDVVCYLGHGAKDALGPGHAECAKKCILSGLPVAIKSGNQLYLAAMADHTAANAKLAQWAGQQVTVHGQIMEQDGQHLITISKIEKAAGGPTAQAKVYTCPMHPEVRQQSPGTCPKCGMALEAR